MINNYEKLKIIQSEKITEIHKQYCSPSKLIGENKNSVIHSYFDNRIGIFKCKKYNCLKLFHKDKPYSAGQTYLIRQFNSCCSNFFIYVPASCCMWDVPDAPYIKELGSLQASTMQCSPVLCCGQFHNLSQSFYS